MTQPAKTAPTVYECGIHERQQCAQNARGVWFKRYQFRDPRFGYKWTPWKATHGKPENAFPYPTKVRLPA